MLAEREEALGKPPLALPGGHPTGWVSLSLGGWEGV